MAKANKAAKRIRKVNGTRPATMADIIKGGKVNFKSRAFHETPFAKSIDHRTVLQAIRREAKASHGALLARIDFLLGKLK
jgi:hypothetical protein